MVFRWRAEDGPTLNADLVALRFSRGSGGSLKLSNHIDFVMFQVVVGGWGGHGPRMLSNNFSPICVCVPSLY